MHRGLIISVLFHTLVVLALAIGLPFVSKPQAQRVAEIPVEIANIASITNPPKGNVKSKSAKAKRERKARVAKPRTAKPAKVKPKAKPKPIPKVVKKPAKPEKKQVATLVQPTPPVKKVEPKKAQPKPAKPKITSRPTLRPKREIKKAKLLQPSSTL